MCLIVIYNTLGIVEIHKTPFLRSTCRNERGGRLFTVFRAFILFTSYNDSRSHDPGGILLPLNEMWGAMTRTTTFQSRTTNELLFIQFNFYLFFFGHYIVSRERWTACAFSPGDRWDDFLLVGHTTRDGFLLEISDYSYYTRTVTFSMCAAERRHSVDDQMFMRIEIESSTYAR